MIVILQTFSCFNVHLMCILCNIIQSFSHTGLLCCPNFSFVVISEAVEKSDTPISEKTPIPAFIGRHTQLCNSMEAHEFGVQVEVSSPPPPSRGGGDTLLVRVKNAGNVTITTLSAERRCDSRERPPAQITLLLGSESI